MKFLQTIKVEEFKELLEAISKIKPKEEIIPLEEARKQNK